MKDNLKELETWKLQEIAKILQNDGFDTKKKLNAIYEVTVSEIILDGRHVRRSNEKAN